MCIRDSLLPSLYTLVRYEGQERYDLFFRLFLILGVGRVDGPALRVNARAAHLPEARDALARAVDGGVGIPAIPALQRVQRRRLHIGGLRLSGEVACLAGVGGEVVELMRAVREAVDVLPLAGADHPAGTVLVEDDDVVVGVLAAEQHAGEAAAGERVRELRAETEQLGTLLSRPVGEDVYKRQTHADTA